MGIIYALICPRTNYIFYIGQTIRKAKDRLNEHINQSLKSKSPTAKEEFILDLINSNLKPTIKTLEINIPLKQINEREKYWVDYYTKQNVALTNILLNPNKPIYKWSIYSLDGNKIIDEIRLLNKKGISNYIIYELYERELNEFYKGYFEWLIKQPLTSSHCKKPLLLKEAIVDIIANYGYIDFKRSKPYYKILKEIIESHK